jgi:hypothetical protein
VNEVVSNPPASHQHVTKRTHYLAL